VITQSLREPGLEAMPIGFIALDHDWRITYVNGAGEAVVGAGWDDLVGAGYWESFPANTDNEFGRTYREVVATGQAQTVEAFYPEPLNRWYEVHAVPVATGLSLYFTEVTARREAQDRLAMVARVGVELAGALDTDQAIGGIAGIVGPVLGDGCLVTLDDDDGRPHVVSSWHDDPARHDTLRSFAGAGEHVPPRELRDLLSGVAPGRVLTTPLRGRERAVGALTILRDGPGEFTPQTRTTAQDVADRVGLAVDNVRLFNEQRQLAETLQRSLLTAPFEPRDAEVAVRYIPAAEVARVGGDWYDAFLQPSGATVLVIGDVVGHDTEAAAAMGQLRALLRGVAVYSDGGPAEVLRGLDAAIDQLQIGTLATAGIARFEQTPEEALRGVTRMRWAGAGHPSPVVVHPDGRLAPVHPEAADLLLGVDMTARRTETVTVLEAGSTVLLFTDGLVERRGSDLDSDLARLRAVTAEVAHLPLQELCDELVERLVHGRPEDDVALVALRLDGPAATPA
jgi:hypothetical protein